MSLEQSAASAVDVLRKAGWFEGRDVGDRLVEWRKRLRLDGFEPSRAAERALREFGGIQVDQRGPGVNLARQSFVIDPLLGLGERDRFEHFEAVLGLPLYPFGECENGATFLAIAADGRVFALAEQIDLAGETALDGIVNLIRGVRGASLRSPLPQALPDAASVANEDV